MWKIIEDFPDYEVSDDGRVRRAKSQRELKPCPCGGYLRVNLRKNKQSHSQYIHRLVAAAFLEGVGEVNHKDGNKANNNVQNLEWVSHQDNVIHSWDVVGRDSPTQRIEVCYLDGRVEIYESMGQCARAFGVDPTTIRDYCDHALRPSRKIQAHFKRV